MFKISKYYKWSLWQHEGDQKNIFFLSIDTHSEDQK